jgi:Tn3 transposase DDE domain
MIPQLSPASVRQAMKWASDERRLAQACSAVLSFMHRHPISTTWGRSDLASSDMMSMETSQRVFVARHDPRRLTPSVGIYSHTHHRWGISYAQPMVLNERTCESAAKCLSHNGQNGLNIQKLRYAPLRIHGRNNSKVPALLARKSRGPGQRPSAGATAGDRVLRHSGWLRCDCEKTAQASRIAPR